MEVILLDNVKKVGQKQEVVKVSLGYGKNYLIKNKLAVEATAENLKKLTKIKKEQQQNRNNEIKEAQSLAQKLEQQTFDFELKLGSNKNVFGKISTKQIAKKLNDLGYDIERKKIKTEGINHLGDETVEIELDKEVIAKIKIKVTGV